MTCRHCAHPRVSRPRGLCHRCYSLTPGVRELYPSDSRYARRGVGNGNRAGTPPAVPCPHPQGSPERMEMLGRRAEAGEALWHPGDCREITADATDRAGHLS